MAATLMHLRRLVRSRLGVPLDDDFMQDNVLDDHINLALQVIDAEAHWPWLEGSETAVLQPAMPYLVPAPGWRATKSVFFGDRELTLVAPGDIMRLWDYTADAPEVWCPVIGSISVRPKPAVSFLVNHFFYRTEDWLYDDGAMPSLPAAYTGAVVAKAAELLSARESSGGDATRHGAEYDKWIARMRRDLRRSTGPVKVRVRPGGWV